MILRNASASSKSTSFNRASVDAEIDAWLASGFLPDSNTGGKFATCDDSDVNSHAGFDLQRAKRAGPAIVDTLTFTNTYYSLFPDGASLDDDTGESRVSSCDLASAVTDVFLSQLNMCLGSDTGRGRNNYKNTRLIYEAGFADSTDSHKIFGFLAYGGNHNKSGQPTFCLHFYGTGCESISYQDDLMPGVWAGLVEAMRNLECKITRIDLAYDDLEGELGGVSAAVGWYKQGGFCAGGRMPSVSQVGDWINGQSRTLYIGKRVNGKLIRVYEKGHQLGDKDSPWVRYELELRSRDRVIPYDAILNPTAHLAGAAPALEAILQVAPRKIKTVVKERLSITFSHLKRFGNLAYGRLVNAWLAIGYTSDQIVDALRKDGFPSRLFIPPAAIPRNGLIDTSRLDFAVGNTSKALDAYLA